MSAWPSDDRLHDLLALRAVEGLEEAERRELADFEARYPGLDTEALDRAAASIALIGLPAEPLPASLRAKLEADAEQWFRGRDTAAEPAVPASAEVVSLAARRPPPATAWGGWLAAAAAVVMAVIGWLQVDRMDQQRAEFAARQGALESEVAQLEREVADQSSALAAAREPAPAELLATLQSQPATRVIDWSATEDPAASGATGAVVWNPEAQAGVMRFSGLQANDPTEWQYQLWIFDA